MNAAFNVHADGKRSDQTYQRRLDCREHVPGDIRGHQAKSFAPNVEA